MSTTSTLASNAGFRGRASEVVDWLLGRAEMEAARSLVALSPLQRERAEHFDACVRCAVRLVVEADDDGDSTRGTTCAALTLLREALCWGVATLDGEAIPQSTVLAWERFPKAMCVSRLPELDLAAAEAALATRNFADTAALPPAALKEDFRAARACVNALGPIIAERRAPMAMPRRRRAVRIVSVALSVTVAVVALYLTARAVIFPDLTAKYPWRASTTYGDPWPTTSLGTGYLPDKKFFFHTAEETSPWVQWDFGTPRTLHSVTVNNLDYCCKERAVPLLVQTSIDGTTFETVAVREELFDSWTTSLHWRKARFLRLTVPRKVFFHLDSVVIR